MKTDNFIKQINETKDKNQLDLSVGEDLSIALMNIISLEEHLLFSYFKTENKKYLEMLGQIRELRKKLLAKIVKKDDDSEKWCMSKHLLASSMRLIEVGTKFLHNKKQKEAEELFIEAFNMYSMFFAINNENLKLNKSMITNNTKLSKISQLVKKILDCCKE